MLPRLGQAELGHLHRAGEAVRQNTGTVGRGAQGAPWRLAQIAAACRQADVIINTIPAHVLGDAALAATARDTPIIELASAPYGLEMQKAVKLGLQVCVESGLPGRYAPLDAGEALFDALTRAMGTRKGLQET